MSIWYYYNKKGEKIQITGGQLKGLAKAGLITPDTMVETENGKSAPAGKVKGLEFTKTVQTETSTTVNTSAFSTAINAAMSNPMPAEPSSYGHQGVPRC